MIDSCSQEDCCSSGLLSDISFFTASRASAATESQVFIDFEKVLLRLKVSSNFKQKERNGIGK
jgi:hypothetical protein